MESFNRTKEKLLRIWTRPERKKKEASHMHYVGNRVEWQNGICAPACPKHHGSIKDA